MHTGGLGSELLSLARAAIVDEAPVVEALRPGRVKAYLSDFPAPALALSLPALSRDRRR